MSSYVLFLALGLGSGAVYGILALGLVLKHRAAGVVDFGHGAVAMYIAYVFLALRADGVLQLPWIVLPHEIDLGAPLAAVPALLALHGVALADRVGRGGALARVAIVWLPPLGAWAAVAALQSLGPGDLARMVADGRLPAATLLGSGAILASCLVLTVSGLRR